MKRVRRHRRRLFWRVWAYGVVMLMAVAAASLSVAVLLDLGPPWRHATGRLTRALMAAQELPDIPADSDEAQRRITRELAELHDILGANVAAYDEDGELRGHRIEEGDEIPSLDPDERRIVDAEGSYMAHPKAKLTVGVGREPPYRAYLVAEFPTSKHSPRKKLMFLGLALLVSAVVMYPLARGLARPLERVAATARALGRGDLSARTGVVRSDELGAMAASFDEMADRIQRLLQSERELLANVSHEFRTPLARLSVALELCEDEPDLDALREQIVGMEGDVRELDHLVEQVLAVSRLDLLERDDTAAGFAFHGETLTVEELAHAAGERFRQRHPRDPIALDVAPGLPALHGDRALLTRALANLLDNAAVHGRGEGQATVALTVAPAAGGVSLTVADRGPGVPPEDVERLFEPFFQADRGRTGSGSRRGVGLGLALCRRIAEAHGGTLLARNRKGGGLEVELTLPVPETTETTEA